MKRIAPAIRRCAAVLLTAHLATSVQASSHMDAPLAVLDPAANTTDVYAFVQVENGVKTLITALGVYPHEEPGVGPNKYNFDPNVLYEIHVALGKDLAAGEPTISYQFQFHSRRSSKTKIRSSSPIWESCKTSATRRKTWSRPTP